MGKKIVCFDALFQRGLAFVRISLFAQLKPVSRFASCAQVFKMYRCFCGHSSGAALCLSALLLSPHLFSMEEVEDMEIDIDISRPIPFTPAEWQPTKIVVFGDSLSDSNGDSFRSPDSAFSTFNLLRTLRGETVTLPDGQQRRPMEIGHLIGQHATIDNIRANIALTAKALQQEGLERSYLGQLLSGLKASIVKAIGKVLTETLTVLDGTSDLIEAAQLSKLRQASEWMGRVANYAGCETLSGRLLAGFERQLGHLHNLVSHGLSNTLVNLGENGLISVLSHFREKISLVPDPNYYSYGKWTAGSLDKVWPEYLPGMMSTGNHQVLLDNRAMAGSWTLCADDKAESFRIIDKLTSSLLSGAEMFIQGSLLPPCEGLIVRAYLDEQRSLFKQHNGRTPRAGDAIIEPDTLIIFFNSANDFLNRWPDPDDVAQEMARDVWNVLDAGARRVAVVLLPDISDVPRFHPDHSQPKDHTAQALSNMVNRYNTSLRMRLNLLREEFNGDGGYQVMTIDGNQMFKSLQTDSRWDLVHPILKIMVPGVDDISLERETVPDNFVENELRENGSFQDTWAIKGDNPISAGKIPFFADSVHPSSEAHYTIAKHVCGMMATTFHIPCNPDNYRAELALAAVLIQ